MGGHGGLSLVNLIRSCKTTTAPAHKMGVGGHRQSGGLTRSGKISKPFLEFGKNMSKKFKVKFTNRKNNATFDSFYFYWEHL